MAHVTYDYSEHEQHVPGDRALGVTVALVGLALLQIGVIVYVAGLRVEPLHPMTYNERMLMPTIIDPSFQASSTGGAIDSTVFRPAEVSPGFDGAGTEIAAAGPVGLWFGPSQAVAHVGFQPDGTAPAAPAAFTFRENGVAIDLGARPAPVPATVEEPEMIRERTELFAAATPPAPAPAPRAHDNVAALVAYLGETGIAEMSDRCNILADEAYRVDGGMMELCREIRTIL